MGAEEEVDNEVEAIGKVPDPPVVMEPLPPLPKFGSIFGSAGTGKSTLIKKYLAARRDVVVTATTGVAALNTGGTTINSRLGYYDLFSLQIAMKNGRLVKSFLSHHLKGIKVWILDEVSMLGGDQLTILTNAIEQANKEILSRQGSSITMVNGPSEQGGQGFNPIRAWDLVDDVHTGLGLASGGSVHRTDLDDEAQLISLVLVGDPCQLPPVKAPWFFESPKWDRFAPHATTLKVNYRQRDPEFIEALRAARSGHGPGALAYFRDRIHAQRDDSFGGLTILATNAEVDAENARKVALCTGREVSFKNCKEGDPKRMGDWKSIPEELKLKIGAKVMLLANYRTADEGLVYVNGDMGTLVGTEGKTPLVQLERNGAVVHVLEAERDIKVPWDRATEAEQHDYLSHLEQRKATLKAGLEQRYKKLDAAIDNLDRLTLQREVDVDEATLADMEEGKEPDFLTVAWMTYTPLRLAYASTVHKCQGLTLDKVQIDLTSGFWTICPGSLYVALSRARTPEGIRLVGSNEKFLARCRADWKCRGYV